MSSFLEPSQCLVYLETDGSVSEVNGYTYVARTIRMFYDKDRLWYEVRLETDSSGKPTVVRNTIFVTSDHVVSERAYASITPKSFYHYTTNGITAENFVIKSDQTNPLTSTSRTALGSGIFGTRTVDYDSPTSNTLRKPYLISVPNAYDVQDTEHGDAITMASSMTNGYIDGILAMVTSQDNVSPLDVVNAVQSVDYTHLVTLWNIVFYRTRDMITNVQLGELLAPYVYNYLRGSSLFDTTTGDELAELPINSIMRSIGYDGLIATDPYNNGWDRGCVSYVYDNADHLVGSIRKDLLFQQVSQ